MLTVMLVPFSVLVPLFTPISGPVVIVQFMVLLSSPLSGSMIVAFSVVLVSGTLMLWLVGRSLLICGLWFVVLKVYHSLVQYVPSVTLRYHV